MSDIVDGGALAPAESHSAPIDTNPTPQSAPISGGAPVADKPDVEAKPEPSKSNREALEKAFAKADGSDKGDKPAALKEGGPARGEGGKFAPKEGAAEAQPAAAAQPEAKPAPKYAAPERFSTDGKAAWDAAPDAVKAETHRALTELQQGYEKHKQGADAYETVKRYDEMARQSGTTLHEALERYTSLENTLRQNPIQGIAKVCENMGFSLNDLVAHLTKQAPDAQTSQSEATIRELRAEINAMKQQVGGVAGHIQTQQQQATASQIDKFASENPRFDELAEDIAEMLRTGYAKDLPDAYAKADRLKPAPAVAQPAPQAATPAPLNPAGQKSISGSPDAGSDPARRMAASPSTRGALERAFQRVGL